MNYKNRRTVRTVLQIVAALAASVPLLVQASGLPSALPGVGVALAVGAAVTRLMAVPVVDDLVDRLLGKLEDE